MNQIIDSDIWKDPERLLKPLEAARHLRVHKQTLIDWDNAGLLPCIRTPGGHRRFRAGDILSRVSNRDLITSGNKLDTRKSYCYARVSTSSQKEDLERQLLYFKEHYPDHEIIRDIGSGLNFKRKGFNTLLELAIKGKLKQVVVTHKDRLCRFGFELFERIIKECSNGELLVLHSDQKTPNEELCNDLLSIITVFSSRLYGLRSHSIKKSLKQHSNRAREQRERREENNREENTKESQQTNSKRPISDLIDYESPEPSDGFDFSSFNRDSNTIIESKESKKKERLEGTEGTKRSKRHTKENSNGSTREKEDNQQEKEEGEGRRKRRGRPRKENN